jgi:hypothetical protein
MPLLQNRLLQFSLKMLSLRDLFNKVATNFYKKISKQ